ncbi:cytosolic protein, partial [Bacillus thuringiensis]|nr:cytosolic protein [Bacillus thuringiensis]
IKLSRMPKKHHTGSSNVHNTKTPFIFYNWLEDNSTKEPSTKTIDSSFVPSMYDKISKEDADAMGLY